METRMWTDEECANAVASAQKAGIKVVVEWVEEHGSPEAHYTGDGHITCSWLELPQNLWRTQKKEWGV